MEIYHLGALNNLNSIGKFLGKFNLYLILSRRNFFFTMMLLKDLEINKNIIGGCFEN